MIVVYVCGVGTVVHQKLAVMEQEHARMKQEHDEMLRQLLNNINELTIEVNRLKKDETPDSGKRFCVCAPSYIVIHNSSKNPFNSPLSGRRWCELSETLTQ